MPIRVFRQIVVRGFVSKRRRPLCGLSLRYLPSGPHLVVSNPPSRSASAYLVTFDRKADLAPRYVRTCVPRNQSVFVRRHMTFLTLVLISASNWTLQSATNRRLTIACCCT